MVNVVVVVVVMMREGSLGSAERLDWENLRDERLLHASSLQVSFAMQRRVDSGLIL